MNYIQSDPSSSLSNLQNQPSNFSYVVPNNTTDTVSPQRIEAVPTQGRARRSRKDRPCDLCRKGKSRCSIGPSGPPCTQCLETGKRCTFDAAPPVRRSRKAPESTQSASPNQPTSLKRKSEGSWRESSNAGDADESMEDDEGPRRAVRIESASTESEGPGRTFEGLQGQSLAPTRFPWISCLQVSSLDESLDGRPFANCRRRVIKCESVARSANREARNPSNRDTADCGQSGDPNRPTFVIFHPSSEADPGIRPGLSQIRTLISAIGRDVTESDLIQRYYVRVNPAWPILPKGKLTSTKRSSLLAAVIATGMRHSSATRPYATLCADILCQMTAQASDDSLIGVAVTVLELGLTGSACSRSNYLKLARVSSAWLEAN